MCNISILNQVDRLYISTIIIKYRYNIKEYYYIIIIVVKVEFIITYIYIPKCVYCKLFILFE